MPAYIALDDKVFSSEGIISAAVEVAHSHGVALPKLLSGTGIFAQDLLDPDHRFNASQIKRLLNQYLKLMKQPDAGFLLGHQLILELGNLGQSLLSSPTLSDALRLLHSFHKQVCPLLHIRFFCNKQRCHLFVSPVFGAEEPLYKLLLQAYSVALYALLKRLSNTYPTCRFHFDHSRARHIYEYEHNLGTRLHFCQPAACWSFPSQLLAVANPHASEIRWRRFALSQPPQFTEQLFSVQVAQHIYQFPQHSQAKLADEMAMSAATFKRKLKEYGWSFSQLQRQQHTIKAMYLLTVKSKANEYVAEQLAFYDTPNFRRAFKRWTGFTPSEAKSISNAL